MTYEEGLGLEAVRQIADGKIRAALKKQTIDPSRVGPLLLTVGDIEVLETLARQHSPRDVIHEYADYFGRNAEDRAGGFLSVVANRGYKRDPAAGQGFVERTFERAMDKAGEEMTRRQAAAEAPQTAPQAGG